MDWFKTDDLSVVLGVTFVAVYALSKFLKPQSLVHPLLLGRQADAGRVRMPGESVVYRNYATGIMGRLPERPKPEVRLISDLIPDENVVRRALWKTVLTNTELKERAAALGAALIQVVGLIPRESTALLLLDDSVEFLVTDLALAQNSIVSFTLSSQPLLVSALEKHAPTTIIAHESTLESILEHVVELRQASHHSIIVVGDEKGSSVLHSQKSGARILRWEDLEIKGRSLEKPIVNPPNPSDVFTVSLFGDQGELCGAQITHMNITAGVTSARLFFPLGDPISSLDTLLSVFPMNTSFGRTIAYTGLYQGANFISLPSALSTDGKSQSPVGLLEFCDKFAVYPTILFLTPDYVQPLASSILQAAKSSLFFALGWRHKIRALQEGFLAKHSFWDNLVWAPARARVLDKLDASLRGIVISQDVLNISELDNARIAFSVPIVLTYSYPLVCGPVMASHPLDLQSFPTKPDVAHVGPPAPNVEVKLKGVGDDSIDKGNDPEGELLIRGPPIAKLIDQDVDSDLWVSTNRMARVCPNGTFKIL